MFVLALCLLLPKPVQRWVGKMFLTLKNFKDQKRGEPNVADIYIKPKIVSYSSYT